MKGLVIPGGGSPEALRTEAPEAAEMVAAFVDEPAVVDGNLVTSRVPDDLPEFTSETPSVVESAAVPT